ncbi:MAG: hypothetical protein AAFX95_06780 [Cyanobacteria bacterium J06639_16]
MKITKLRLVSVLFSGLALVFGFTIRMFVVLRFTNFSGDQINDAERVMGIWQGIVPSLGPGPIAWSGLTGDVSLPPLYYYLTFPFTIITPDLSAQAIQNFIFTFLSIPLLGIVIYQAISGINQEKRLFIASLSMLWYACLFRNIVMSTGDSLAGNPVSIPFFLLWFTLLYSYQFKALRNPSIKKIEILSWIAYGLSLVMLMNLHFTPFFVMPVVFLIGLFFYILKYPKRIKILLLSGISLITAILMMLPYWIGEIERGWTNSNRIFLLITKSSDGDSYSVTLLQRLQAIASGYFHLGSEVYIMGNSWERVSLSFVFLSIVVILGLAKFKGDRSILMILIATWLVFLFAYSSVNLDNTYNPVFYKLLIYLAPIFLTAFSLAYLDFSKKTGKALSILLGFFISISMFVNLGFHYNYVTGRAGNPRIPNTKDVAAALLEIPEKSTICSPSGRYDDVRTYEYTDNFVSQRGLNIQTDCEANRYFIYAKYESVGNFTMRPRESFREKFEDFGKPYSLYKDLPLFYIYQISS